MGMAAFLVVWVALQVWLLPKLGVPTCAVPAPRRSARHDESSDEA